MKAKISYRQFVECPECSKATFDITDLVGVWHSFGPWYCKNCGQGVRGKITASGDVDIEAVEKHEPRLHLIYASQPFFFVIQSFEPTSITLDDLEYRIEKRSCPSNTLNAGIEEVISIDKVTDPHGLLELVASAHCSFDEYADQVCNLDFDELNKLFDGALQSVILKS